MLKQWQFDVLFFVGVGGAIVLLFGPQLGIDIKSNPLAASGIGAILTFVLRQRQTLTKKDEDPKEGRDERSDQ